MSVSDKCYTKNSSQNTRIPPPLPRNEHTQIGGRFLLELHYQILKICTIESWSSPFKCMERFKLWQAYVYMVDYFQKSFSKCTGTTSCTSLRTTALFQLYPHHLRCVVTKVHLLLLISQWPPAKTHNNNAVTSVCVQNYTKTDTLQ